MESARAQNWHNPRAGAGAYAALIGWTAFETSKPNAPSPLGAGIGSGGLFFRPL